MFIPKDTHVMRASIMASCVYTPRYWARLFRHLHWTERQFRESQFQDYVWLGDICGIAFSIPHIFVVPKMKFSIAFLALRS